jgi:hypothetical protein
MANISTSVQASLHLVGIAHSTKHPGAKGLGQLNGGQANAGRAAMDQKAFTGFQVSALKHIGPDREIVFWQGRCLQQAHALGNGQALALRQTHELGVTAAIGQATQGVTQFPARHALAQRHHMARGLQTQNGRCAWRWRIAATSLQAIWAVDTGIGHLDQHLARAGRGHSGLRQRQDIGGATSAVRHVIHQINGHVFKLSVDNIKREMEGRKKLQCQQLVKVVFGHAWAHRACRCALAPHPNVEHLVC